MSMQAASNTDPRNILLLATTTIICLIIIEIALRVLFGFGNPALYRQDPDIGLDLAPDQTTRRLFSSEISINSEGFRSDRIPGQKGPDEYRIFVIGDSITYGGEYITTEDLYTSILQKRLQQENKGKKIRVINAGTNAHSIMNMQKKYEHRIRALSPDAVIVYVPEGDFERPFANYEPGPIGPFWDRKPLLALQDVANYLLNYLRLRLTPQESRSTEDIRQTTEDNLNAAKKMFEQARQDGAKYFIVITPNRGQVYANNTIDQNLHQKLEGLIPENRIIYLLDCFKENKGKKIYRDTVHYLPEGHEVAGECLMKTLGNKIV